ncbi:hypothetical protein HPP92_027432 [Vanilla planifolia]|uniref:Uncharacterized protein n=1 Tax=Vanilla planifolia TaxID=51239 RepID=A0A835PB78_VANPL|nr:hypothetical protein HPP92_027432 [Vanilla planifolia]KAG0449220.1 hypothetical protein HPP92_027459 [Vanilla planifolia]
MESQSVHLLLLPWLAFGHLLPYLELSQSLARKGYRISFITTPRNIKRLPQIPPALSSLVTFLDFPLPRIEHLPENAEATIDLPSDDLRPYLRQAFDDMAPKLSAFLEDPQSSPPDFIIFDYAAYWVPSIAAKFSIPCAYFGLHTAAAFSFYGSTSVLMGDEGARSRPEDFTVLPPWIPFPSTIVYRRHEAFELFKPGVVPDASGVSESYRFGKSIQGCAAILVRSCFEFEREWIELLEKIYKKRVIPVGLLPPSAAPDEIPSQDRHEALKWLDEREQGSVVYVAFGTEVKLTVSQVWEIGLGLERSHLPFVWALRAGELSEGLLERMQGIERGLLCLGWVPQIRILAHPAVGGFLTHGGWNSIVEGLAFGRGMVVLPMIFDQGLNARYLVEKGIAVEVERDEEDGSFTGEGIAESLRLVMVEAQGKTFLEASRESSKVFGDEELSDSYVTDLVGTLRAVATLEK